MFIILFNKYKTYFKNEFISNQMKNVYIWHKRNRLNMMSVNNVYNIISGTTALDLYFTNGVNTLVKLKTYA